MPHESDNTRSAPVQFSMRTLFVVMTGVVLIVGFSFWPLFGCATGVLIVGTWWSWLAVRQPAPTVAYYVTACMQGAILAGVLILNSLLGISTGGVRLPPPHMTCIAMTLFACGSALLTTRILRERILQAEGWKPWETGVRFICFTAAWIGLGLATVGTLVFVSMGTGLPGPGDLLFLGAALLSLPFMLILSLPITGPLGIVFCLWLRAVAGVQRLFPERFQFSISTMLMAIISVAVLGAFSSWPPTGCVPGFLIVGTWWNWLAVRRQSQPMVYFVTACLQGAILATAPVVAVRLSSHGSLDLATPLIVMAAIFCCCSLVTAAVLQRSISNSIARPPRGVRAISPYTLMAYAWLCVTALGTYDILVGTPLAPPEQDPLILLTVAGVAQFFVIATISLPTKGPRGVFAYLWLRKPWGVRRYANWTQTDSSERSVLDAAQEDTHVTG